MKITPKAATLMPTACAEVRDVELLGIETAVVEGVEVSTGADVVDIGSAELVAAAVTEEMVVASIADDVPVETAEDDVGEATTTVVVVVPEWELEEKLEVVAGRVSVLCVGVAAPLCALHML